MVYFGGGGAPVFFFLRRFFGFGVPGRESLPGAGDGAEGCESTVCGEFGASVLSEAGGVSAGRVTTSPAVSGR